MLLLKDSSNNPNPLIRALAIRTMGCIRLERIAEYFYHPLKAALQVKIKFIIFTFAILVQNVFILIFFVYIFFQHK